jgi:hypothetical protein
MAKDSSGTLCSKCGERPRAESHKWCKECKAEAQQGYDSDRERMIEARGFNAGAMAFKASLIASMLGSKGFHPSGMVMLGEIANFVDRMPLPKYQPT